jgi:hypothetical protein
MDWQTDTDADDSECQADSGMCEGKAKRGISNVCLALM